MVVFNSVSDIFQINFSFSSMLILDFIEFSGFSCICGFVCVPLYSFEKNVLQYFRISKAFVNIVVLLFCTFSKLFYCLYFLFFLVIETCLITVI